MHRHTQAATIGTSERRLAITILINTPLLSVNFTAKELINQLLRLQ